MSQQLPPQQLSRQQFPKESRTIRRLVSAIATPEADNTPSWVMPYSAKASDKTAASASGSKTSGSKSSRLKIDPRETAEMQPELWMQPRLPRATAQEVFFPKMGRSKILIGLLCALLGFALALQFRTTNVDQLATLRQEDLVRLLEEVTARENQLDEEIDRLLAARQELTTGSDQARAALEVARTRASVEGILSGRLPALGPGLRIEITDPGNDLTAREYINLLEELRNAGAEVIQVGEYRVVTSSTFTNLRGTILLDGNTLPTDVTWLVIGDPGTMDRALEIPGGALPQIRRAGAVTAVTQYDLENPVEITATANLRPPMYAQPVLADG